MEYHEAANFLFELRQFRPKPGTASTRDLLAQIDDPHLAYPAVQIGGTNGKGSTARMLEAILRTDGRSVGLYTSPHFDDLRERFRVDGRLIPKAAVVEFVEAVEGYITRRAADGDPVTFFEATTAMALWFFGREEVDIAVLEVGIGGQFDATCVVDPVASAVTNVSLEHTEILGETVQEIARDKAHVAPRDTALITAARGEALEAIRTRVAELHEERDTGLPPAEHVCTVGDGGHDVSIDYEGRTNHVESAIALEGPDWTIETRIPLLGAFQATNAGIAAALARELDVDDVSTIAHGLRSAYWPGRAEVMNDAPLVMLDGAHNPDACEHLRTILDEFAYDRLLLVVGVMHEKDHTAMAAALPTPDVVYPCRPATERAGDQAALATVFDEAGAGTVTPVAPVEEAVEAALAEANPDDCVLVTGSLFTVAEARQRWVRASMPKRIRDRDDVRRALSAADADLDVHAGTVDAGVHRVLKTRVYPRQARWLEKELRTLGGAGASTAQHETVEEPVDLLLLGTEAHFASLLETMEDAPEGIGALRKHVAPLIGTNDTPDRAFPWAEEPAIMGILNVTPDSFHDGAQYETPNAAIARAEAMIEAGATIVDVGGESTRPGAEPVDDDTEIERVVPVIEALGDREVMLSVDTRKANVAEAALEAGADMLNDVSGLEDPEMRFVAAEYDVPLVVMHSIDAPVVPGRHTEYDDVVEDVIRDLRERVLLAEKAGLDREQIIVDPGVGFGKAPAESFELIGRAGELRGLGCPIMIGHSHKSMFDAIDRAAGERLSATVAGTAIATAAGADIIRVHDVPENVAAVRAVLAAGTREE